MNVVRTTEGIKKLALAIQLRAVAIHKRLYLEVPSRRAEKIRDEIPIKTAAKRTMLAG
jgi:hypothetical protein